MGGLPEDQRLMNDGQAKIFCALGGCGSTYLGRTLQQGGYTVLRKPDTVFSRHIHILNEYTTMAEKRRYFSKRAPKLLEYNISDEIDLEFALNDVLKLDGYILISSTLYEANRYSNRNIRNVCFLVRNPKDGYLSYCKEQRHKKVSDALGGLYSPESIGFYASRWNALIDEYKRSVSLSLTPKLIRYEQFPMDFAKVFPQIDTLDFDYGRTNEWPEFGTHSEHLDSLVRHNIKYINEIYNL